MTGPQPHSTQPVDVVAFAPHPDDAEVGCGGLLLLAARRGLSTAIVDLTAGEMSTRGDRTIRTAERAEATRLLGLTHREQLGLPDTATGTDPSHMDAVVASLRRLRPRLALLPLPDRHPDHRGTADLVKRALFLANVAKVGTGTPHRTDLVLQYLVHGTVSPTLVLDTSDVWATQRDAMAAYASQFDGSADPNQPATALSGGDFLRAHEARAIHFGSLVGARFGEPYVADGPLRFADPLALFSDGPTSTYRASS